MPGPAYQRRYDLDWLRVTAFTLLILFHTGMMFNTWEWHVKNPETSVVLEYFMIFLNQWRMSLLFLISGAAVWFAMEKYTTGRFALERVKRLLVPLVFGMFVVIPPQVFYERVFQGQAFSSFWSFYPTVLELRPYPEGNFSWHHLWYIPYVFVFSFLALPVFRYLKSERGRQRLSGWMAALSRGNRIFLTLVPIAVCQMLLRPFWPDNYHNLLGDWANFAVSLIIFATGFVFASSEEIWQTLERQRYRSLGTAALLNVLLYGVWFNDWGASIFPEEAYWLLKSGNLWFWILAILGFASRHLRFTSPFLSYANEAVYPFYILHQTITVIAGFYLVRWQAGLWLKFLVLAFVTFGGCAVAYELIRRIAVLRPLFGLKFRRGRSRRKGRTDAPVQVGAPAVAGSTASTGDVC